MNKQEQIEFMIEHGVTEIVAVLAFSKFGSLPKFSEYQFIRTLCEL